MEIAAKIMVALIGLVHFYIMWFEMFAWESRGPKVFRGFPKDLFPKTKSMAANQGLYNGFLGAGLFWSLLIGDPTWSQNVVLFFLSCVVVAGLYGWYSVSKRILFVQVLPGVLGILLVLLS